MIVVECLSAEPARTARPVVATVGNFDGLHVGHRAIMKRITDRAAGLGGSSVVVTFTPHPLRILAPERAPRLLVTRDQKLALLVSLGIDAVYLIPFDRSLAGMPAESFVRDVLVEQVAVGEVYIGPDFRFGRGRAGDLGLLERLGRELGFAAAAVDPVLDAGERVSASRVRRALAEGRVEDASRLLGRPFALVGTIVHGEGRGRSMQFPTANLAVENEFLPARGVYISRTGWGKTTREGLTNIGIRPTFGDRRLIVETFLPGFEGEIYGERAELELLARLRDERKFATPADLREQIQRDVDAFEAWRRDR